MEIFRRKIQKKHISRFEILLAEKLENEFPEILIATKLPQQLKLHFPKNPPGIYISRIYDNSTFKILNKNHRTYFHLNGISVYNKKERKFIALRLWFQYNRLTNISVDNPTRFHINFDLEKIRIENLSRENLEITNPDKKFVLEALKTLSKEDLELLELDSTFEIDFDNKVYYPIIDMEDGNSIATDKNGRIYRLNHENHKEPIKLIFKKPQNFIDRFQGKKENLEDIMD